MEIAGKTFLVSGGASGLGAATVRHLAGQGAFVVVADLNAADGERMAHHLGQQGLFVPTDVTSEAAVQAAVTAGRRGLWRVCTAPSAAQASASAKRYWASGASTARLLPPGDRDQPDRHLQRGPPGRRSHGRKRAEAGGERGVLINTASVAAFDGQIGQAAYAASKGGIVGMTLPIARDLAPLGIRVVTIAPGHLRDAALGRAARSGAAFAGQQVAFPLSAWGARRNSRPWSRTSSRTRCSTAR